jgi:site-specific DNA-adenine methylase
LVEIRKNASADFFHFCETTLLTQDDSLRQVGNDLLSDEELKVITHNKGGASLLLYRIVLGDDLKKGEKEAIYALGNLVQLTNDVFDIYKDLQDNQQTLYTNTTDFEQSYKEYMNLYRDMNQRFCALDYDKKRLKYFLYKVSTIVSRAMVCFDQFLLLQNSKQGRFNMREWERKELICDMEKPANIFKALKYSTHILKEIDAYI